MDRQRTTQTTNRHEELAKVGLGGQKFREFVKDDEERRKDWEVMLSSYTIRFIIRDICIVTGITQDLLATNHFTVESIFHTVDQRQFRLQVRNHRRDVRQV